MNRNSIRKFRSEQVAIDALQRLERAFAVVIEQLDVHIASVRDLELSLRSSLAALELRVASLERAAKGTTVAAMDGAVMR